MGKKNKTRKDGKFSPVGLSELINCMTNVTNSNFPKSRLSRKQFEFAKKPWLTRDILNSIKHQNKLYGKYKKSLSEYDFKCYKTYRNKLTRLKDAAEAMYFQNLLKKSKNTSMTWKAVNKILRKNPSNPNSLPAQLNVKGKLISDPSNVCHELNQYFCSIGHEMAKNITIKSKQPFSNYFCGKRVRNSIYFNPTNEYEIIGIISSLNPNKASGVDDIPTKLIIAAKYILAPYLTEIINSCLAKGQYLKELKIARIVPLYKGGSKNEPKNYRPTSILTSLNKIFETILKRQLMDFWNKYNVFFPTQFGFRENFSTTLAITHLREYILNELDSNMNICAVFMDLAKAFDTVNHDILLFKLEQYGIRGDANDLLKSYLSNRKQLVSGDVASSSLLEIDIGVPQGSVLGPTLFLIHINDLSHCSNLNSTLYADDSVLMLSHKNVNILKSNMEMELSKLNIWLSSNQLSLNLSKTKFMLFTKSSQNIAIQIQ